MKNILQGQTLGKQNARAILRELQRLREVATLDKANFNEMNCGAAPKKIMLNPYTDITDFIRDQTRLYRHSWLIDPLDELMAQLTPFAE